MEHIELLRSAMAPRKKVEKAPSKPVTGTVLDGSDEDEDLAIDSAEAFAQTSVAMAAASAIQQWVESDDLDDGETAADRLLAMMVGIADANKDGELSEDEQGVVEEALNAAWDYLVKFGVSEEDASALLNDWDEDAAVRVRDLVAASLPEGEDAADADIDNFVFGDEAQESAFDSAITLDAAYKKVIAVRKGKKVRINKRISGHVRLSAKQKLSIRKAGMKAHSAKAVMRRMKSMRLRKKSGL